MEKIIKEKTESGPDIPKVIKGKNGTIYKLVSIHPYYDSRNKIQYYTVRYECEDSGPNKRHKVFKQYSKSPNGTWIAKAIKGKKFLYRLNKLLKAALNVPVIIVEGEKACEALEKLIEAKEINIEGIPTAYSGGSNNCTNVDYSILKGRKVILIPDMDLAGVLCIAKLIEALRKDGVKDISVVELPYELLSNHVKGWDVADPLPKDYTYEELSNEIQNPKKYEDIAAYKEVVKSAENAKEKVKINPEINKKQDEILKEPTDIAKRFLVENNLVVVYINGDFEIWSKNKYKIISEKHLAARITKFLQSYIGKTITQINGKGDEYEENVLQFKPTKGNINTLLICLAGLTVIPLYTRERSFLYNQQLKGEFLQMSNGIINIQEVLSGGKHALIKPTSIFYTHTALDYKYDAQAKCPEFLSFLDTVLPDRSLQKILQEWFGYCLSGDMRYHKFIILFGEGANGKSVVLNILESMLGAENVSHVSLESFGDTFGLGYTYQKLANICSEISYVEKTAEGILKSYTAGDFISFNRKYKDPISAVPTAKLTFAGNILPRFNDKSNGIWRRILLMPFNVTIPEDQQDKRLGSRIIKNELPGIFNWALEGLKRLREQDGFTISEASNESVKEYKEESNSCILFFKEFCEADEYSEVKSDRLYEAYSFFCKSNGLLPNSNIVFGKELKKAFPNVTKTQGPNKKYRGIHWNGMDDFEIMRALKS